VTRRERKIVTVLFADLVGFTARAETLDPEDVEAILRPYHERLRSELERRGGTVEKFIGDAVMALFGAPVGHEDDPERAVRAALAIREAALEQGFDVRVAVNTGEALVSLDADPRAGEAMAAGDVVNTAARLQAAAPVNGILVGEATQRATREAIDYRPADAVEAKGKAAPVAAWVAVEARSPFGVDVRQHGGSPLVGRQRELEVLLGAFERACAERSPELVTLVGVPGIGKSRLLWELFQSLDRHEGLVRWRQGRALPYGSLSFWAVAEMVKAHAGILEDDDRDATAAKLHAAVAVAAPEAERAWVEAHLRNLVGLEAEQSRDRAEAFTAWRRFFEGVAEGAPLVLVFEDLHWADDGLLDFVDHLVDWTVGVPIVVLCSARPELLERRPGWGGGKLNAHTLALSPLGETDTATLLAAALEQSVLPAETQAALLERAGGNPLYAEQFARLYRETGRVEKLPESIQGIVAARLDALAREEKELLQNAAVLGKVFWLGAVEAMGCERAAALVHGLGRKEFVRRERRAAVGGEVELAFRHVLVRDVAYAQIPRADRSVKHAAAGAWIEALGRPEDHAELIAHHYATSLELARAAGTQSAELVDRARRALRDAGDRAHALGAYDAAAGHYGHALELWPNDEPDRALLLFGRARARTWAGDADERELREAAAALLGIGRAELAAEVESLLSQVAWYANDGGRSKEHLRRALELVEPLPDSASKAWILAEASRLALLATEYDDSLEYGRRALVLADALGLPHVRAHTLTSIGNSRAYRGDAEGIRLVEDAVATARELNSPLLPRCLNNLSVAYGLYGRTREARDTMQAAITAGGRFGLGPMLRFSRANLAGQLYDTGRWDEALREAQALLDEAQATGLHAIERMALGRRALIRLWRGDVSGADADTSRALELAHEAEEPQAVLPALAVRTIFLSASGRFDEARPLAQELLARGAESQLPYPGGADFWYVARCVDPDEALASLIGRNTWRTPWLDAIEELLRGDPDRAVELYAALEAPTDEAFARLWAAETHLAAGRRTESEAHLEGALEFYRSVGATYYVEQAEALLVGPAVERRPA
jgi:class 3 adenylate cyclase/tetratricopeptide (TPR) repeat protein